MALTTEFRLNIGVNPGYFHGNDNKTPIETIVSIWQEIAGKTFEETGIFVAAIVTPAKTIYPTQWGCPPNGEDTVLVCGLRNTEFLTDDNVWRNAVIKVAKQVTIALEQKTAYLTFEEIDFLYIKQNEKI